MTKKTNFNLKKHKWFKWEFWPYWLFYLPVYFQYFYYGLKARSFGFFSASNPLMKFGGASTYSKYNVLKHIHADYIPITIHSYPPFQNIDLKKYKLSYPIIMKPDIGARGFSVEKIDNQEMFDNYLSNSKHSILIQEFIDYPIELGIMYHRFPNEDKGKITSVVKKEVLWIQGDGVSTIAQLIEKGERTAFHKEMLYEMHESTLTQILAEGEKKQLSDIGNHIRGATFYNANYLINEQLHSIFDQIAIPIDGYHFGRFDLKVPSIEDLYAGKNIKILELNGANSEPTHIYDPNMPLLKAYKDLFKHWSIMYSISIANHKLGVPFNSIWEITRTMRKYYKER